VGAAQSAGAVDVSVIRAPFSPQQVAALNRWQVDGRFHPFTCGDDGHEANVRLIACVDGWRCAVQLCGYTQDWAHDFMAVDQ
jgi:hypothetical protein